jgi:hypothetical protein
MVVSSEVIGYYPIKIPDIKGSLEEWQMLQIYRHVQPITEKIPDVLPSYSH